MKKIRHQKKHLRRTDFSRYKSGIKRFAAFTSVALVAFLAIRLLPMVPGAAVLSAGMMMPEGGRHLMEEDARNWESPFEGESVSGTASLPQDNSVSQTPATESDPASQVTTESSVSSASPTASSNEKLLPVKETKVGSGNIKSGVVEVLSKLKNYTIDIDQYLAERPDVHIKDTTAPQVLIVHTHTSEAYMDSFTGTYPESFDPRTKDASHSVIRVGDVLTQKLNEAGIATIHDTTYHDDPAYNGAYTRSMQTTQKYLEKYPSIQVVLDVHRDSLTQADGTKLKPTVTINGKKAAQIMIVSGCDDDGSIGYPEWQYNMRFGLRLQKEIATKYSGLARPLYTWNIRYNQHLTHGSLLVEFGTDANTDEEVSYSAELFADALIGVLNELKD